ncbi:MULTISPECIES: isochorismate synthase [Pseudomonas]|uniref:Salicylate biosynthesis isochorismate synthase n=1 Tax=Pseudomonas hunanensis TaxID=1247546 RepID=A0ACC6K9U8_9PSED|nr:MULTISPECIES: isochorismate synthase [Pseudomonas]MBP2261350.1 salicylate biosynthesis isochorismate synthase [Pseudomonas sp. BP8]MDR6715180.1 salicylate biosynthesis isochorismate synthase [Pseudomonas hunanensis]HDS1734546.1 isochorismate synthase [Pseudomonas putida]
MKRIHAAQWSRWRALLEQGRARAASLGRHVLVSLSLPVSAFDVFEQVASAENFAIPYALIESRDPEHLLFGLGHADELVDDQGLPLAQMASHWQQWLEEGVHEGELGPMMMGGARFDADSQRKAHWADFPAAVMTLHALQWFQRPEGCGLLLQARVGGESDIQALVSDRQRLLECMGSPPPVSAGASVVSGVDRDSVPHERWKAAVATAVERIRSGQMRKVVLARHVQRTHPASIDVASLLRRLRERDPGAHLFAVRRGDSCFLGATPERLAHLAQGIVHTHALAGTTPRGADAESDLRLGEALMESAKEREEHDLVVRTIRESLERLGASVEAEQMPELRRLPTLQHLSTPMRAKLNARIGVLEVVDTLHPTPAVAGLALDQALAFIRGHEGLDRGWYAGPLGWMNDRAEGDFFVALRSVLVRGAEAYLFAGCGVVADSLPELEFDETRLKLSGMFNALQTRRETTAVLTSA